MGSNFTKRIGEGVNGMEVLDRKRKMKSMSRCTTIVDFTCNYGLIMGLQNITQL